jgi:hypothetical protein
VHFLKVRIIASKSSTNENEANGSFANSFFPRMEACKLHLQLKLDFSCSTREMPAPPQAIWL